MENLFHFVISMIRLRGRTWLFALSAIVIVAWSAYAQENRGHRIGDTSYVPLRYTGPGLSIRKPVHPSLPTPATGGLDFAMFMRQSLIQSSPLSPEAFHYAAGIESMWKDELTRQNEYQTLWNIVGAIETGAVGYLAYRHLARYGLK
jgi:hypothetical protein